MTDEEPGYGEASMAAAARGMRQVYVALVKEGFTPTQALEIVKAMLPRTQT